jgi:hypothetical protein
MEHFIASEPTITERSCQTTIDPSTISMHPSNARENSNVDSDLGLLRLVSAVLDLDLGSGPIVAPNAIYPRINHGLPISTLPRRSFVAENAVLIT